MVKAFDFHVSEHGDVAQMVERSLSMREALGSMPRFSTFLWRYIMSRLTYDPVLNLEFADLAEASLV